MDDPTAAPPKPGAYKTAYLLRPEEARRLLRAIDRRSSLVAGRDYAIILTLLLTGLPEARIRCLRWADLEIDPAGASLLPAPGAPATRLPGPAWEAILAYLSASGRLATLQLDDYLFPPLADPLLRPPTGRPDDWSPDRPISFHTLRVALRTYAAWAGLDAARVTTNCLHHTAAALFLQAGADAAELQARFGHTQFRATRRYLHHLADMQARRGPVPRWRRRRPAVFALDPATAGPAGPAASRRGDRHAHFGNTNNLKHGFHSRRIFPADLPPGDGQDPETWEPGDELTAEIAVLRLLLRRGARLAAGIDNLPDLITILDRFGKASTRLARLLVKKKKLAEVSPVELLYRAIAEVNDEMGLNETFGPRVDRTRS